MEQQYQNIAAIPGSVNIEGEVAARLEEFAWERITSDFAWNVVYKEAEDAFRNQLDDASGIHGIWQGEFWGKWIISAVRYCEYSGDGELKERIRQGVATLIGMQEPSGYLGTYRDPLNVFAADPDKTEPVLGWRCNWNWNIWCRKYTLWGLLEAHRLLGDASILAAADKLAEHLIRSLRENNIRLGSTGTFAGIPSGSILKPILILYRATGREEYLDFAKKIAADWQREDGAIPNLIANALSGKPVHHWYPEPKTWAKAYEMLSCFDGILELYRVTGERKLLESAIRFHTLLKKDEFNLLFSVGFNDIFHHGAARINGNTEPCDVIHWMRFCGELFLETGDKTYLDDFETAFYNPFLAGVCRDGKWAARGARSHGHHLFVDKQAGMTHNHCCVNNIPRGFMNFARMQTTRCGNAVSVNFYSPFHAEIGLLNGGIVKLRVTGNYPGTGEINIDWEANLIEPGVLRLRVPAWATTVALKTDHAFKEVDGWLEITLLPGKSGAVLEFGREVEIREHAARGEESEWFFQRWTEPGMEAMYRRERGSTLVYGPLLLARSQLAGNGKEEMFGSPLPVGFRCTLRPVEREGVVHAFEAELESEGEIRQTTVCDYASAGNLMSADQKLFSIFF